MWKLILILIIVFSIDNLFAQNSELNYKVDTNIFNKKNGNNYLSDSTGAKLICIILPMSYEQALKGMSHESNKDIVLLDSGELQKTKRRIRYKIGELKDDKADLIIEVYLIEYENGNSVMLTGNYERKYKSIIRDAIEISARSF